MMLCRDPQGGYARYLCPGCQYEHRVPFSCKTRFCPSCGYPEVLIIPKNRKKALNWGVLGKFEQKLRDNISTDVMPIHAIITPGISLKTILEALQYGRNIIIRAH
jgi:hypothetical protein